MKIVITGAGGGHFYPLIAVIENVRKQAFIQKITQPEVFFFSDQAYDEKALFEQEIKFIQIPAGKLRLYPSSENFTGFFKTVFGCVSAIFKLYSIYPDVVFVKGGYASVPTIVAAKILSIPIVVHESDTIPGRTTLFAGKSATRVALSYREAAAFFSKEKVALTGQPIREASIPREGYVRQYVKKDRPVIMVLCGSQGSQRVNEAILKVLPELLNHYDIVHAVGALNLEDMKKVTTELLHEHPFKGHYFLDGFIDVALFYPKVDFVITRGSSAMFEIAVWQLPMLVIPIPKVISRDQSSNAHAMAERGVAVVLEENNLGNSMLLLEISRVFSNQDIYEKMSKAGLQFENSRHAGETIARELLRICLSHL